MNPQGINILAIETSCDDTCAAVISKGEIVSNIITSQMIHSQYGGVVPEISSREHLSNLPKAVCRALSSAGIGFQDLSAIAFTAGPGLHGPLLVGSTYSKGLSLSLGGIPLIAVNHLLGHIFAGNIDNNYSFPFLCLLVSGGNSMIVKISSFSKAEILCQTVDDALGEAFDKIAKIIGLEYPGGKNIDILSQGGDINRYKFPTITTSNDKFSFSGIKTAFKLFIEKEEKEDNNFVNDNIKDICASIQNHLLKTVEKKLLFWLKTTGIKAISIGGGVAANSVLRRMIQELAERLQIKMLIPKKEYCVDNAAMIAFLAYEKYKKGEFVGYDYQINSKLKF